MGEKLFFHSYISPSLRGRGLDVPKFLTLKKIHPEETFLKNLPTMYVFTLELNSNMVLLESNMSPTI